MSCCHVCVYIMAPLRPLHHLLDVNIPSLCQRCHFPILPFNFAYHLPLKILGYIHLACNIKIGSGWSFNANANAILQYSLLLVLMIANGKTVTNKPGSNWWLIFDQMLSQQHMELAKHLHQQMWLPYPIMGLDEQWRNVQFCKHTLHSYVYPASN